jgi:hypothetical protein
MLKELAKIPALSVLLLVSSYAVFGWLLSVHGQEWYWWIPTGAISLSIAWFTAIVWALAAIIIVFSRQKIFFLSIGVSLIWFFLMYIARTELQAYTQNRYLSRATMVILAGAGLGLGWFADINLFKSVGQKLLSSLYFYWQLSLG